MPAKKTSDNPPVEEPDQHTIPVPTEEIEGDEYHITFQVVANIVKMATLSIEGVHAVKDGSEGIWETFGGRKGEKGVDVTEDEAGNYVVKIHVEMKFGVELAKIAKIIQEHVRAEVQRMTDKSVSKVDVFIDGVVMESNVKEEARETWNEPHTD
ncbi:MAG: Asp23/Gls24 family envelope stress response protein [Verrucomicrobiota bacterium]